MKCTKDEKIMLTKVNEIGMKMSTNPEDELIFVVLSPYLDHLMSFLKSLDINGMSMVFFEYEGVMKVMRMIENAAQEMETA